MEPIIAANDTPPPDDLVDILVALYCRPGGAFEHNDRALERIRIAWEWPPASG